MKYRTKLISLIASCGVSLANANSITIMNQSLAEKPLKIVFRTAHQNKTGDKVSFGQPQTISLGKRYTADITHNEENLASGIVIDSIDGHALPEKVREFNKPETCSMATNTLAPTGSIILIEETNVDGHGSINCKTEGGLTE